MIYLWGKQVFDQAERAFRQPEGQRGRWQRRRCHTASAPAIGYDSPLFPVVGPHIRRKCLIFAGQPATIRVTLAMAVTATFQAAYQGLLKLLMPLSVRRRKADAEIFIEFDCFLF